MKNNYRTEQRKIIRDYLIDNKDKFVNVEEIMQYMKKRKQEVGQTTIYRYLNLLEENNNVRTEIKNHTKHYQYIESECCNHFHLKCKKCGKTIHLHCEEFENVSNHIKEEHKFNLDHNTIIYGLCDECVE
ncbi:MAG: transcriptional repressor [Clostridia bacterium]|nr:transcriptional repressor [Clostridia bacterium]